VLLVLKKVSEVWWYGANINCLSTTGYFPCQYVKESTSPLALMTTTTSSTSTSIVGHNNDSNNKNNSDKRGSSSRSMYAMKTLSLQVSAVGSNSSDRFDNNGFHAVDVDHHHDDHLLHSSSSYDYDSKGSITVTIPIRHKNNKHTSTISRLLNTTKDITSTTPINHRNHDDDDDGDEKQPIYVIVKHKYESTGRSDLTIHPNDVLLVLKEVSEVWWYGANVSSLQLRGYFPATCVEIYKYDNGYDNDDDHEDDVYNVDDNGDANDGDDEGGDNRGAYGNDNYIDIRDILDNDDRDDAKYEEGKIKHNMR